MKIIFASKFYYRRGGLESYLFKTKELLESFGHEVIPFSTDYYENSETEYSRYFCRYYDLSKESFSIKKGLNNISAFKNMLFNKEAYDNMKKLIKDTKPDLVQGFGITKHLSYSIFKAAKDMKVPTVMRLSDYAILCPDSTAIDGLGRICSDFSCSKGDFRRALKTKCVHNSVTASIIGQLEVRLNLLLNVYKKNIDYFIAPSQFIRDIFIQNIGISSQRIIYLPIFIDSKNSSVNDNCDNYFLYAGRLSREKGIKTLLRAFEKNKTYKLVIAGTGPDERKLKKFAAEKDVQAEFVGFQHFENLQDLIKKCRAVIIPSEWYENSPNIILEAYAHGKPVIGSRIGGIPELIEDGKTGFLFEMGNEADLYGKLKMISDNEELRLEMGAKAKAFIKEKFTPTDHYKKLIDIYGSVTKKKVLLVNNFYYNRGGDCTYLFALKKILESKNHNVVIFSMHHPDNYVSAWSKYFVSHINYDEEVKKIDLRSAIKVATRTIFFLRAKKMIGKLIKEERPNIAHLHNIHHHITPSILYPLRKNKIPIVWTLHDYQLICPNISFLANGRICERCKRHRYYWPPIVRCKKGSFAASLMSSIEVTIHNISGIKRFVNYYIAPSKFLREKFIEFGFNPEKLRHLNHVIDARCENNAVEADDYYLYVGRISEEKGIKTLINAALKVNLSKLKIVGSGPLLTEIMNYTCIQDRNKRIEFLGQKSHAEVFELIKRCKFLVIPSEWYEVAGLVIFEAYSCEKPVLASRVGGIPEFISENKTGITFEMKNVEDLSHKIQYLLNNPDETAKMGKNAKAFFEEEMSLEKHYQEILQIYDQAGR